MGDWKILDDSASFMDLELDYGFKVHQMPGLGMAPVENISTPFGLLDGALFQRTRTDVRRFSLNGWIQGATIPDLLSKRKALVELLRADRFSPQQPVVLQFSGGTTTVQGSAFYDGGMELGEISNNTELDVSIQFVQYDPYWEGSNASGAVQASASLATGDTVTGSLLVKEDGVWSGCLPVVACTSEFATVAVDSTGRIYMGGGDAGVPDTAFIQQRDPTTGSWSHVGGGTDYEVANISVAQDDSVFVAGRFGKVYNTAPCSGATTVKSVARWIPSSSSWETLTGASGEGVTIAGAGFTSFADMVFARNNVYFGGSFGEMGGACGTRRMAEWSIGASEWSSLGETGSGTAAGAAVTDISISQNERYIYIAGSLAKAGSTSVSRMGFYDLNSPSGDWVALPATPTGGAGSPDVIHVAGDGTLYTGGGQGGVENFQSGNGQGWFSVGGGITGAVTTIAEDKETGLIVFIGNTSEDLNTFGSELLTWDGSRFDHADLYFTQSPALVDVKTASGNLYLVKREQGEIHTAGITTITNSGTAQAFPIIKLSQTGGATDQKLIAIRNLTTKQNLLFDYVLSEQEVLTIDLSPDKKSIESNFGGNKTSILQPGSDISDFHLTTGDNKMAVFFFVKILSPFVAGTLTATASMLFADKFWGIDNG